MLLILLLGEINRSVLGRLWLPRHHHFRNPDLVQRIAHHTQQISQRLLQRHGLGVQRQIDHRPKHGANDGLLVERPNGGRVQGVDQRNVLERIARLQAKQFALMLPPVAAGLVRFGRSPGAGREAGRIHAGRIGEHVRIVVVGWGVILGGGGCFAFLFFGSNGEQTGFVFEKLMPIGEERLVGEGGVGGEMFANEGS